jgi:hypothetical protein
MRRACFLVVLSFVTSGCHDTRSEPDPPGYTLTIRDDVPSEMKLIDKRGNVHIGNGRELYARGHKSGWRQCWSEHQRGDLNLKDEDAYTNHIPSDYGVAVQGFVDGFKACQRMLAGE